MGRIDWAAVVSVVVVTTGTLAAMDALGAAGVERDLLAVLLGVSVGGAVLLAGELRCREREP